jgi:adenine/guanine phosphoribosyltransferase-like PRPP-binding protein
VRIVVAAVIAPAADAVLVAHHLQKLGAHLVTARPFKKVAWRQEARNTKRGGVDDFEASDKQLCSCAAGKVNYAALCV